MRRGRLAVAGATALATLVAGATLAVSTAGEKAPAKAQPTPLQLAAKRLLAQYAREGTDCGCTAALRAKERVADGRVAKALAADGG